jgi:choline dehydrogenase-like flavoprotein
VAQAEPFDVCVIGTGAGGGVMIDRLTAAGLRVVALERGPRLTTAEFDDDELRNVVRDAVFSPQQLETYDEMEPFYARAERDFGVAGVADANPFGPPRKSGYPNPPHPQRASARVFSRGAKQLGYTPFPVPMAINSQPYGNRPRCMYGGACRSYGCPIHAKGTTLSVSLPRAEVSGRLDLRPDAMVFEIPVKDGRVTGARYLDSSGAQHEVRARHVVVAAGSIGTPQLLLLSTSGSFPQGLANGSGQVGRHFTFHHHPSAVGVFDEDLRAYTGFETHAAIDDLHPSDAKRGFIRGGVVAELNTFTHQPIAFATVLANGMGGERPWGAELKQRLRAFPRTLVLAAICEELPMEDNRIDLDPEVKDRFGLPVPRITKRQHANDVAMYRWYERKLVEIAEAAGASRVWPGRIEGIHIDENTFQKSNAHNHGTCRMGDDPKRSVVDRWCRSHEVRNLWVVDGSVMPTNGGYNPTLTILANAYRVADHFVGEAKRQSL